MRSEEARIGAKVMVGEAGLGSEWQGLAGTIIGKWAIPSTWPSMCSWMTGARCCSGTTSLSRSMLAVHNSQGAARGPGLKGLPSARSPCGRCC